MAKLSARAFRRVLALKPDDAAAANYLGYMWADKGTNLTEALELIQTAVALEPDNGAFLDSLGWALFRLGRNAEAIVELEKAAEIQPDGVIFDHLGDVYQKSQQPEKARAAYRRAAECFRKEKNEEKAKEIEEKFSRDP